MRFRQFSLTLSTIFLSLGSLAPGASAQHKGEPGHFDFYL